MGIAVSILMLIFSHYNSRKGEISLIINAHHIGEPGHFPRPYLAPSCDGMLITGNIPFFAICCLFAYSRSSQTPHMYRYFASANISHAWLGITTTLGARGQCLSRECGIL